MLNSPCGSAKSHSEGIVTFVIGVQCFQCSTKRLVPHLAEFLASTVGRSLEFVAFKKFRQKNLELKTTTINEPCGELNFTFHLHVFTHSFRVKHVVCSPSKVVFGFDLIIAIDSLTVIPFSLSAKNLRRISQQRLRAK